MYILWTEEEVVILKNMVEKGADRQTIQRVLSSRSPKAIESKMYDLRLTFNIPIIINHSAYQDFLNSIKGQKVKHA